MGKSCCAIKCTNRFNKDSEIPFHRLPKGKEKREKWIAALHRDNWNPGREAWICGRHFVSGKKSDDPLHPDYVPSLFSFTSTADRTRAVVNLERYLRSQNVSEKGAQPNTSREQAAVNRRHSRASPAQATRKHLLCVKGLGWTCRRQTRHRAQRYTDRLLQGDMVLADRGLTGEDATGLFCAETVTPPLTEGEKQLIRKETESV